MELSKQENQKCAKCYILSKDGTDCFPDCRCKRCHTKQEEEKIYHCINISHRELGLKFPCERCQILDTPPITTKAEWEERFNELFCYKDSQDGKWKLHAMVSFADNYKSFIKQVEQDTEKRVVGEERMRIWKEMCILAEPDERQFNQGEIKTDLDDVHKIINNLKSKYDK